mmetsp:Transcript_5783/g.16870  ORF Transcript_5783/g.16870 Transcript_5783/m.16870 type:complete len:282 (+) Transcript_5783:746-1591(+)
MSQTTKRAKRRSSNRTLGWMNVVTSCMAGPMQCCMKRSAWLSAKAPTISQQAIRSSTPSSSPSSSATASSSSAGLLRFCASSASRSFREAFKVLRATWQMCCTCWAFRTPGPAFFRQALTPSAAVLSPSVSKPWASATAPVAPTFSNLGKILFRNSCTSSATILIWLLPRAHWQRRPQVSKAVSLTSSSMEKSKTKSRACAVWATKGAKSLPNSSTKVWTQQTAFDSSSISDVLMIITFVVPSAPVTRDKLTSSSSPSWPATSCPHSLGFRVNFSRTPGKM